MTMNLFDMQPADDWLPAGCALSENINGIWSLSVRGEVLTVAEFSRQPTVRRIEGTTVVALDWWGLPSRTAAVRLAQEVAG